MEIEWLIARFPTRSESTVFCVTFDMLIFADYFWQEKAGRMETKRHSIETQKPQLTGFLLSIKPRENKEKRPKTRLADPDGVETRTDWSGNETRASGK